MRWILETSMSCRVQEGGQTTLTIRPGGSEDLLACLPSHAPLASTHVQLHSEQMVD